MPRSGRSDNFVMLTSVAVLVLGVVFVGVRLALATMVASASTNVLTDISVLLAPVLLISLLLWTIAMLLRRRRLRLYREAKQRQSRSASRRTHSSTMQTQWKQPDPGSAWANTHHDTRERTTSTERNSQVDGWFNSSVQASALLQDSIQINSLDQNSLQSHTVAPNMQLRHAKAPICWTLELIQELEWRKFDTIAGEFFSSIGLEARPVEKGPDHEINLRVWQPGDTAVYAVVRTRAGAPVIDLEQVREFYAVMTHEHIAQGFLITGGRFSAQAVTAARGTGLFLIDGTTLSQRIVSLPAAQQEALLQLATEGDFRSPSCPACGQKMALRSGDFKSFWRCTGYPACRARMVLAADTTPALD